MENILKRMRGAGGETKGGRAAEEGPGALFAGWFNNHMAVILMLIQRARVRPPRVMMKIEFFLEDLEHHYVPSDADEQVREAFRYLTEYFGSYPAVEGRQSRRALEMVVRVYEAVGLKLADPGRFARLAVPEKPCVAAPHGGWLSRLAGIARPVPR